MTILSLLLVALLAASPPVPTTCAPDPPGTVVPAGGETYIRDAEAAWAASIATDEAAFLKRYTTESFVALFDGEVLSRAALIEGAEKRVPGTATNTPQSVNVHLYGPTAVAQGSEIWAEAASDHRLRIIWTDLWVHCGGEWRLATSTAIGSPLK